VVQHRVFRRTKQETIFGIVHRFFGPTIIVLALINGGLGLDLAGKTAQSMMRVVYSND
jgi:hypothetical protein